MEKFARKCSVTGKGMNEGYVFSDGEFYAKDEESAKVIALREFDKELEDMWPSEDEMENADWQVYWTQWEDEDDYQYIEVNGKLIEIE